MEPLNTSPLAVTQLLRAAEDALALLRQLKSDDERIDPDSKLEVDLEQAIWGVGGYECEVCHQKKLIPEGGICTDCFRR
jgi:hypothetical protein